MFEISFGELILIGLVALIVLGPEKLPSVARTLGALVGRLQRFVLSVKTELHEQTGMAELQALKHDFQASAQQFRHQMEHEVAEIQSQLRFDEQSPHHTESSDAAEPSSTKNETEPNPNQLDLFDPPAPSSSLPHSEKK